MTRHLLLGLGATVALAACSPSAPTAAPAATAAAPAQPGIRLLPDVTDLGFAALPAGTLLRQLHVADDDGEGLMLLSRQEDAFTDEDGVDQDRITLTATLYQRDDAQSAWELAWQNVDPTECPGLDLQAGFFLEPFQATDLDGDGRAEYTVASHAFCGGGVDPHALQILLVQGDDALVVEGESVVQVEGDPPFGGDRQDSPEVAEAPAAIRQHLDQVWARIKQGPAA
ncbi:hypothetical protein [Stenotrophomonas sp. 24(2023)]|uniref:M949_RS01915 family surface polysaccharide biosynthesis protein n=1 Tax=Stenotrophomonas sp. 24(2023) TaxID=3068324 RepID=UPI0027DEFE96|nr:hypothetical protein [Stenotrophomonas sp. 24(2023)]WMJ69562.1 hypothetical protein Q9R17_00160 [Stenotrophomonas sp. 24(2023)]